MYPTNACELTYLPALFLDGRVTCMSSFAAHIATAMHATQDHTHLHFSTHPRTRKCMPARARPPAQKRALSTATVPVYQDGRTLRVLVTVQFNKANYDIDISDVKLSFSSHRRGLCFALVGAAEDVELAALLRLALNDVDATEVDVDAARPPVVKFFFQNQII